MFIFLIFCYILYLTFLFDIALLTVNLHMTNKSILI